MGRRGERENVRLTLAFFYFVWFSRRRSSQDEGVEVKADSADIILALSDGVGKSGGFLGWNVCAWKAGVGDVGYIL